MSEVNNDTQVKIPKITAEVKTKNPGRVAAGKRLAEISKAARERKKQESLTTQVATPDTLFTYQNILALAGLGIGLAALFYELRQRKVPSPSAASLSLKFESPTSGTQSGTVEIKKTHLLTPN